MSFWLGPQQLLFFPLVFFSHLTSFLLMLAHSQPRFSISISSPEAHHQQRLSTCGRAKEKLHRWTRKAARDPRTHPDILSSLLKSFLSKDGMSWIKLDVMKIWRTETLCVSVRAAQDTREKEGGRDPALSYNTPKHQNHTSNIYTGKTDTKQHFNTNLDCSTHLKYNGTSCHTLEGTWCS